MSKIEIAKPKRVSNDQNTIAKPKRVSNEQKQDFNL